MQNTTIVGIIEAIFVMGGVSAKTKKLYLQVSDGISAEFIAIPKDTDLQDSVFDNYSRGDKITIEVEVSPFSKKATLLSVQ